ncbi:hypothetical protein CDAR_615741 [Caerostris darwini]|uniref:Uncharacterized protein n=1 Tax=Caerostris darwini TaxID=1538125 RepID=A0AAV4RXK0_9ARAC|nr:hypothetical protein CDAR_615741 [Caerostris darwini]
MDSMFSYKSYLLKTSKEKLIHIWVPLGLQSLPKTFNAKSEEINIKRPSSIQVAFGISCTLLLEILHPSQLFLSAQRGSQYVPRVKDSRSDFLSCGVTHPRFLQTVGHGGK